MLILDDLSSKNGDLLWIMHQNWGYQRNFSHRNVTKNDVYNPDIDGQVSIDNMVSTVI